ncbi:MAG: NYN domain-containing protein [Peptostreptococcaceae bacterium]
MRKNIKKCYLMIDGYNIINAWDDLKEISKSNLEDARERLIHYIIEYAQYTGKKAIVVFDAYNVKSSKENIEERKYVTIVYTKEHQTADSYIEKFISSLSKYDDIEVATSDYAEQQIVLGKGASRISARELKLYIDSAMEKIKIEQKKHQKKIQRNFLEDRLDQDILSKLENIRRKH